MAGLVSLLSEVMSASLNGEVDLDNARVALSAATKIIEAVQADTRMKAIAISSNRSIVASGGWPMIESEKTVS